MRDEDGVEEGESKGKVETVGVSVVSMENQEEEIS